MVEAFGKACIKEVSTARLECGGMEFVAKGTVVREGGWRKVRREPEERPDDTTAALPALDKNDLLPVKGCDAERKQTKPRPIHTESSLLSAMEPSVRGAARRRFSILKSPNARTPTAALQSGAPSPASSLRTLSLPSC